MQARAECFGQHPGVVQRVVRAALDHAVVGGQRLQLVVRQREPEILGERDGAQALADGERAYFARAYSREIIDQSKKALWATSTRSASRSENPSVDLGEQRRPGQQSVVRPWIQAGPGSRSG